MKVRNFNILIVFQKLNFQFKCGANEITLSTKKNVNQGEWHTIEFGVNHNRAFLTVDGDAVDSEPVGCKPINVAPPFYVGGMDIPTLAIATSHLKVKSSLSQITRDLHMHDMYKHVLPMDISGFLDHGFNFWKVWAI